MIFYLIAIEILKIQWYIESIQISFESAKVANVSLPFNWNTLKRI